MTSPIKSMLGSVKGAIDMTTVVVDVVLVVALVPVIKTFISSATNLSTSETLLLGTVTLFIVLALIVNTVKGMGLKKK